MAEHYGHVVHFVDTDGNHHEALVTRFWGNVSEAPSINLIYMQPGLNDLPFAIDGGGSNQNGYGHLPICANSVAHQTNQSDNKRYWHWPHE